jgi:lysophospholipase L1-like esterase
MSVGKKIALSILLFFLFMEVLLRLWGEYKTPNEKASNEYYYRYRKQLPTWVHRWKPNKTTDYRQVEFRYQNKYNEFGLREYYLDSFTRDTNTIKILCLGDSFTEGDGAPYDSSWVRVTERVANESGRKYKLYNAGVCGSDVFFNHQWLNTDVMRIKPKLVIECINTSDLCDVVWMGGKDRFNPDSTTSGKVGPRWEIVYRFSHVFRAFVHKVLKYDTNLMKDVDLNNSIPIIREELVLTQQQLARQGVEYKVVLHVCPHEVLFPKSVNTPFFENLSMLPFVMDVSNEMELTINKNNLNQYYWPINGHYNWRGYQVLGDVIYSKVLKAKK